MVIHYDICNLVLSYYLFYGGSKHDILLTHITIINYSADLFSNGKINF